MNKPGDRVQNVFSGEVGTVIKAGSCTVVDLDNGTTARGDFRAWLPYDKEDPPELLLNIASHQSEAYKRGFDDGVKSVTGKE